MQTPTEILSMINIMRACQYVFLVRICSFFNLGYTRRKQAIIMTTTCPRHNNVMQFLETSKKLSSGLTGVLLVLEKSYFNFALNVFL